MEASQGLIRRLTFQVTEGDVGEELVFSQEILGSDLSYRRIYWQGSFHVHLDYFRAGRQRCYFQGEIVLCHGLYASARYGTFVMARHVLKLRQVERIGCVDLPDTERAVVGADCCLGVVRTS